MASNSPVWPRKDTFSESDEYFMHNCDLCSEDSQRAEATVFCTVCMQYLCAKCGKVHTRISSAQSHKLLSGKDMPEKPAELKLKPKCKQHPEKIIEYFCQDHKVACCLTCQVLHHRMCQKLINFKDLDMRRNFKEECKQKLASMHYLLDELKRIETVNENNVSDAEKRKDDLIKTIKKARKRVDQHLDKLEAEIVCQIRHDIQNGVRDLNKRSDIQCILAEISTQIKEFEETLTTFSKDQEIVMTVMIESEIKKYATVITDLIMNSFQLEANLRISEEVKAFSKQILSFGEADIVKNYNNISRPFEKRKAVYCQEIDVSAPSDVRQTEVKSIEVLPTGSLLICDAGNNKIKLFDSKFEFLNEADLTCQPKSMVMLTLTGGTVSLPDEQSLQDLTLTDMSSLTLGKKFRTSIRVYELTRSKDDEIIALANDKSFWHLCRMSRNGQVYACLKKEPASGGLFDMPLTICLSSDQKILYLLDVFNGCFGISLNGDILFHYQDACMQMYVGMCRINDRLICISGPNSDKMILVNSAGEQVNVLLAVQGLETLTYCTKSNQLFAENTSMKSVSVFMFI